MRPARRDAELRYFLGMPRTGLRATHVSLTEDERRTGVALDESLE
jgi:hypothetical protein